MQRTMRRRPSGHELSGSRVRADSLAADTGGDDRAEQRLILASCGLLLAGAILLAGSWWLKATRQAEVASAMAADAGALVVPGVPSSAFGPAEGWVVVEPGDTLWSLAARHGPPGQDPRDLVEELARLNGLGPSHRLKPGQALRLPGGWSVTGR